MRQYYDSEYIEDIKREQWASGFALGCGLSVAGCGLLLIALAVLW